MLDITEEAVGDVTVLHLSGRLVLEDEGQPLQGMVDRLVDEGRVKLLLDLRDVSYLDSSGLGLLVSEFVNVRRHGGDLRFVRPTPWTSRLMDITHLGSVFETYPTEDQGIRSFERA
jgi:anti-sigma B factor antagonist